MRELSPAINPFVGGSPLPANPQYSGGAMEVGSGDAAEGILGAVNVSDPAAKAVPGTVATLVLVAVGVIVVSHFLGVRAGAAISLGGKK